MKMNDQCLPCLVSQVVKVAEAVHVKDKVSLYQKVFRYFSEMDFTRSNPEVIGAAFRLLKECTGSKDPYRQTRDYYNQLFLKLLGQFEEKIDQSANPFEEAVKYAAIGNIIDFNPVHNNGIDKILRYFSNAEAMEFTVNHLEALEEDIRRSKTLLYLGDNCGEICLDKLLLQKIKQRNPQLQIYFGVRGAPVVNDSIEEDAISVGMSEYAQIISNGDDSLGTILDQVSGEFFRVYQEADFIIAKGQANYESLSEERGKRIYFLLITKCAVIADNLGVPQKSLICLNNQLPQ